MLAAAAAAAAVVVVAAAAAEESVSMSSSGSSRNRAELSSLPAIFCGRGELPTRSTVWCISSTSPAGMPYPARSPCGLDGVLGKQQRRWLDGDGRVQILHRGGVQKVGIHPGCQSGNIILKNGVREEKIGKDQVTVED